MHIDRAAFLATAFLCLLIGCSSSPRRTPEERAAEQEKAFAVEGQADVWVRTPFWIRVGERRFSLGQWVEKVGGKPVLPAGFEPAPFPPTFAGFLEWLSQQPIRRDLVVITYEPGLSLSGFSPDPGIRYETPEQMIAGLTPRFLNQGFRRVVFTVSSSMNGEWIVKDSAAQAP